MRKATVVLGCALRTAAVFSQLATLPSPPSAEGDPASAHCAPRDQIDLAIRHLGRVYEAILQAEQLQITRQELSRARCRCCPRTCRWPCCYSRICWIHPS